MSASSSRLASYEDSQSFGIYIHFPYCERICTYCDFVVVSAPEIPHQEYADAILREFESRADRFAGMKLSSIYFGGGTPSLWAPKQLSRIIQRVIAQYGDDYLEEITLEANPGPRISEYLDDYAEAGVNRVSLGIQSLNDRILQTIRRTHTAKEALHNLEYLNEYPSISEVSADLIYGLPGSTTQSVQQDALRFIDLGIKHISLYALTVETGTPLERSVTRKSIELPDDKSVMEQAEALWQLTTDHGFTYYEVSSVAKPGHEAKHNALYWHLRGFMGLGVGAHGLERVAPMESRQYANWVCRENSKNLKRYFQNPTQHDLEQPHSRKSWLRDLFIVRPRWLQGFSEDEFYMHTTPAETSLIKSELSHMSEEGLVTRTAQCTRLTRNGILVADGITERLFSHLSD